MPIDPDFQDTVYPYKSKQMFVLNYLSLIVETCIHMMTLILVV